MRHLIMTLPITISLCSWPASAAQLVNGVLGHLIGTWTISGTLLGHPTHTGADVKPVFGGAFLEMHVLDPEGQDHYEALIFFGQATDHKLVVHWLDGTGGETSRTLGTGQVSGDLASITFPYPDGIFRDRLTYDPARDRWRLLIEMGPEAHPKTFSDWFFERAKAH